MTTTTTAPAVSEAVSAVLTPLGGPQGVGGDPREAPVARTAGEVAQTLDGFKRFAGGTPTPRDPSTRAADEAAETLHGSAHLVTRICRCGETFQARAGVRGRPQVHCSHSCAVAAVREAEKSAQRPPRPPCASCSNLIPAGHSRYCSARCSLVARGLARATPLEKRTCALEECDRTFTPRRESERCCSERHGKTHWNRQARAAVRALSDGSHHG